MKKLLCLFTLLALISPAFNKPVRIMVFGDSNSWGFEPNPNPPSVDSLSTAAGPASYKTSSAAITK